MSEERKMDETKKQQCMYGVLCKKKDTCDFFHPVKSRRMKKPCMYGVLCNRKSECNFFHPKTNRTQSSTTDVNSKDRNYSRNRENGQTQLKVKTKMCKFFNTEEGCKKGDNCSFRHSNEEVDQKE